MEILTLIILSYVYTIEITTFLSLVPSWYLALKVFEIYSRKFVNVIMVVTGLLLALTIIFLNFQTFL